MYKKILACVMFMAIYSIANSDQLSDGLVVLNNGTVPQTDDFWQRLRAGFRLDRKETDLVRYYEKRYTQNPKAFQKIMTNAKPYIYYVLLETERNGFPSEIALLPIVESSYNPFAVSPAGISTGMWQFVGMTGKRFNLAQTSQIDERQDTVKSTKAALKYLAYLNDMFGRWDLTLAAYNWGEGRIYGIIQTAQKNGNSLAYNDLPFRDATKSYVPKLVALANIIENPSKFGVKLDSMPNEPYFAIVSSGANFNTQKVIDFATIHANSFKELNPQFKVDNYSFIKDQKLLLPTGKQNIYAINAGFKSMPQVAISSESSVIIKVANSESNADVVVSAIKPSAESNIRVVEHSNTAKIDDLINEIALEPKVTINSTTRVEKKQVMPNKIVVSQKEQTLVNKPHVVANKKPAKLSKVKIVHYKVKHGDTLYSISKKFNANITEIKHDNKIAGNEIKLNQILQIK